MNVLIHVALLSLVSCSGGFMENARASGLVAHPQEICVFELASDYQDWSACCLAGSCPVVYHEPKRVPGIEA